MTWWYGTIVQEQYSTVPLQYNCTVQHSTRINAVQYSRTPVCMTASVNLKRNPNQGLFGGLGYHTHVRVLVGPVKGVNCIRLICS